MLMCKVITFVFGPHTHTHTHRWCSTLKHVSRGQWWTTCLLTLMVSWTLSAELLSCKKKKKKMNQHQVMRVKLMLVYAFDGIRLGSCDFYFSCFNFFFFLNQPCVTLRVMLTRQMSGPWFEDFCFWLLVFCKNPLNAEVSCPACGHL